MYSEPVAILTGVSYNKKITGRNGTEMNNIYTGSVSRSMEMSIEEIQKEREQSGWNPYEKEEETWQIEIPYFMRPEYSQVLEEQKAMEQDLRSLQGMYPQSAKQLLPYVEEECDKMEYEGSAMYARYPDPTTIQNVQDRIYNQVRHQFDVEEPSGPEDIVSMQYQRGKRDPRGKNWLDQLVRVLLLQEIHHRRCRHRGCLSWK